MFVEAAVLMIWLPLISERLRAVEVDPTVRLHTGIPGSREQQYAGDRSLTHADELTQLTSGVVLYGSMTSMPSMNWEPCFSHAVDTAYMDVARQHHRPRL
jgi:hypothetical protein